MKKNVLKTLCLLALSATALPCAALSLAKIPASAAAVSDTLLSPLSYEEYLSLDEPADVAVTDGYTAIADGNRLHVFNRAKNEYRTLSMPSGTITKIQFDDNDNLYVLDSLMDFHRVDLATEEISHVSALQCTAFFINGNDLFYTTAAGGKSKLFKTQLSSPDKSTADELAGNLSGTPALAFWNDELYFTDESFITHLYKINPTSKEIAEVGSFPTAIAAMTISGGELACTEETQDFKGDFCTYPLTHLSATNPIQRVEGAYSAVAAFDNFVYVIHGESVKKYAVETESFTSFEICAKSDSLHRLNGATTAYLSGETLYIADNGNHRVSVYNTAENTFLQPFNATLPITFLSADENSLLTANENQAVIHSLNPTANEEKSFVNFNGKIVGTVNVYGKYYLTTTSNYFYCLSKNDNGEWSIAECKKTSTRYPKLLTADAYGTLYILSGNDVYSFTEETFMQAGETGETAFTSIPADATQISVDYERNLYALSGDTLYHSHRGGAGESFSFSNPLVYYPEQSTPQINAFAFGIENNQTYVLCDNSYLLVSERMQLPTVKNIAVDGADESIFANTSAQFTVVKTTQNALLIEFDVSSLQGASVFPYMQYERSSEEKTALKIGTANEYDLLAYFDREQNKYRTYLVLSSACTSLPNDEYCVIYDETEQKIGYLTNAVPLYKFPYLTDLLTAGQLPRGAQVTVLGEINELDHAYYHVSYVDENGVEKTGYVPQTYITEFSGLPPQSDLHESGATESDFDSVWRFAYLLLGFGAICILVDFLILRKKGDND